MTQEPKDWTGFLQQHQAEMQSRTPKHKVSLGQAMKSASKPWKKYKRTLKHKGNERVQGGSALSPSSFSETDTHPATLPTVGGSTCPFKGGRKGRKGKKTRRSRD